MHTVINIWKSNERKEYILLATEKFRVFLYYRLIEYLYISMTMSIPKAQVTFT